MNTHSFKLITGVECEISPLLGEHRDIFLNRKYIQNGKNMIMLLASIVVRLGSKTNITQDDIRSLLSEDASQILVEARLFDNDFEPNFRIEHIFEGEKEGKKLKRTSFFDVDLTAIESKPYHYFENGNFVEIKCSEYGEVLEKAVGIPFQLRKSEQMVLFDLLNLRHQEKSILAKQELTPTSMLSIRNLRFAETTDKRIDVGKLPNKDISELSQFIKQCEGQFDTIVELDNPLYDPESDQSLENQPKKRLPLIGIPDFLFGGIAS